MSRRARDDQCRQAAEASQHLGGRRVLDELGDRAQPEAAHGPDHGAHDHLIGRVAREPADGQRPHPEPDRVQVGELPEGRVPGLLRRVPPAGERGMHTDSVGTPDPRDLRG
jgi:hypothetical protein